MEVFVAIPKTAISTFFTLVKNISHYSENMIQRIDQSMEKEKINGEVLDQIMARNTGELPNSLQGLTFSAFNAGGDVLYSRARGTRTLESSSQAVTTDTPIWTASLTKLVTTVACMIAVDMGLLTLDSNVRKIVPELKEVDLLVGFEDSTTTPRKPILREVTAPITLRQLLSHTSGFTYDVFDVGLIEWSRGLGRTSHSHCGSMQGYMHPLIHEPGQGWAYGPGMDWAGRAVEVLSGQTLDDFMREHIFKPLDMKDTTFRPELVPDYLSRKMEHTVRDPSTGALKQGGGHHLLACPAKDCIGGMGLYSTPCDLVKILKEVLAGGGKIVSRESVAEMLRSQLNDSTQAAFMEVIDGKAKYHLRQTWPDDASDGTFGLSASINLKAFPGRRGERSMNWAGSSGVHAWIDPISGVGGLMTSQLSPPGDRMLTRCFLDLETELYKQLRD